MSNLLEQLGLSKEDAIELIIERAVDFLLQRERGYYNDKILCEIREKTNALIEKSVDEEIKKTVTPLLNKEIKSFVIQETNRFGEKRGEPKTLIEFAADKCSTYFQEKVDSNGKLSNSYDSTSRISWLMGTEFNRQMRKISEDILKKSNEILIDSMAKSVQSSLNEISKKIIK